MIYALQHEKGTGREKESFAKIVELPGKCIQIKPEYFRSHPEESTSI